MNLVLVVITIHCNVIVLHVWTNPGGRDGLKDFGLVNFSGDKGESQNFWA